MILPLENFKGNSKGEIFVWEKFKSFLPSSYTSFHNYTIGLKQVDVILLCPQKGILVIEIKGHHAKNILDVPDNTVIRIKDGENVSSPFNQALNYKNILLTDFLYPNHINNVYVIPSVCYPFINKDEYMDKGLNKISDPRITITSEDLENSEKFLSKIQEIFKVAYDSIAVPELKKYGFDAELMKKVGNIISPNYQNIFANGNEKNVNNKNEISVDLSSKREIYSRLIYINADTTFKETQIDTLISDWASGTKIYFYSENVKLIEHIKEKLVEKIKNRKLEGKAKFDITKSNPFLFEISIAVPCGKSFELKNGENIQEYLREIELLHNNSSFNKDQYLIEHALLDDLIVKAGAGTGKTFSIVSRINYLIWKKDYDASDLKNAIVMITFTNKSADDMKKKLVENFLNYYFLTKDILFLEFVESVEDMNICTIHSLSRKILKKFSSKLGLGCEFKISTGKYERRQLLYKQLNEHIQKNQNIGKKLDELEISMFHLVERLLDLLGKIDNKNVDIVNDEALLNFGKDIYGRFDELIEVIRDTQKELNLNCNNNNVVCLGDLIRKLRVLHSELEKDKNKNAFYGKIDFLFVDEFQDTDDIQIELMKSFQKIFDFEFFVVGDVKQCIYRFRGAQEKAFDTLSGCSKMPTISLNKNYRTDAKLLNELNSIFSKWDINGDIEYKPFDVLQGTKNHCHKAELYSVEHNDKQDLQKKLVKTIEEFKKRLTGENDKIAILVRYNWQIPKIKEMCEKSQINVETEIGGELFKIDPTIDLYKLILALLYNDSAGHLYNLYTTSYIKEDLPKIPLYSKSEGATVEFFYENLPKTFGKWNEYLERLRKEPVLKVIRDIVDDIKPWEIFSFCKIKELGLEGEERVKEIERNESYYIRNLDQLFEKLVSTMNTDYLTINKLSEYLEIMILTRQEEEARASYDLENSKAKVICTTVHKSKGLEYDTVILPFCDFDISCGRAKGTVDLIYSGKELGYRISGEGFKVIFENDLYDKYQKNEVQDRKYEETRILYVALTRAIRHIVYFVNVNTRYKENWDKMIKGDKW